MDFQSSRAQFALDAAAVSVLNAWENSQRHRPSASTSTTVIHRPHMRYNNGFPISPLTPSSSPPSSTSLTLSNQWTPCPSSVSEYEMLQLHRAMMPATAPIADREPCLPASNAQTQFFNFDFSLPNLPHLPVQQPQHPQQHFQQQQQQQQQQQLLLLQQQRCSPPLPTPTTPSSSSTLFNSPPVSPASNMSYRRESPSSSHSSSGSKRVSDECSSSTASSAKKPRAYASLKDYVPPDVTGLSKREARLVKNRAAAFLSRQRKREEFELMEIRVAELERENARLREMADGASPEPSSSTDSPELDLLRMQLAASRQRESELVHRLEMLKHEQQKVKMESNEPSLSDGTSSGANSPVMAPTLPFKNIVSNPKTGASLGLMVLLCALPSLLSQPSSHSRSTLPTSQPFLDTIQWDASSIFQASTSATIDEIPSWELDFSGTQSGATTGNMDMDVDYANMHNAKEEEPEWQKLELGLDGGEGMGMGIAGLELGALDISFATTRTKDGKFRVRVHSSASSSALVSPSKPETISPTPDDLANTMRTGLSASLPSPAQSNSSSTPEIDSNVNPLAFSFVDADPLGPFLGAGSSPTGTATFELGAPFDLAGSNADPRQLISGFSGFEAGMRTGERRRVRIALRSLPQQGGEGGEWEIEVR
ncbi:hypothetical protein ACEPAH_5292 [Sanghuangporus vaninii]